MGARQVQGAGAGRRGAGRGPERGGRGDWGRTWEGWGREAGRGVSAWTRKNQMIREYEPEVREDPGQAGGSWQVTGVEKGDVEQSGDGVGVATLAGGQG